MRNPLLSPADSLTNQAEQVSAPSVGATSHKRTAVSRTSLAACAAFGLSRPSLNLRPIRLALPGDSSRKHCYVVHSSVDAMTARGQSVVLLGTSAVAGRMNASVFGVGCLGPSRDDAEKPPVLSPVPSQASKPAVAPMRLLSQPTAAINRVGVARGHNATSATSTPPPSSPVCRAVRGPVATASLARCACSYSR